MDGWRRLGRAIVGGLLLPSSALFALQTARGTVRTTSGGKVAIRTTKDDWGKPAPRVGSVCVAGKVAD